jgi:hypothetical protein
LVIPDGPVYATRQHCELMCLAGPDIAFTTVIASP